MNIFSKIRDRVITAVQGVPLASVVRVHSLVVDGFCAFQSELPGGMRIDAFVAAFLRQDLSYEPFPRIQRLIELELSTSFDSELIFTGCVIAAHDDGRRIVMPLTRPSLARGERRFASSGSIGESQRGLRVTSIVADGTVGGLL